MVSQPLESILAEIQNIPTYHYELDGGGRHLFENLLHTFHAPTVLQIGCFLNGSVRRWLTVHPRLKITTLDPWNYDASKLLRNWSELSHMQSTFSQIKDRDVFIEDVAQHGLRNSALANVREFADRYRYAIGHSPECLKKLKDEGLEPDLIYIDADKKVDDLSEVAELWPKSIIAGDDYNWRPDLGFPMKQIVDKFADEHNMKVLAEKATWVLQA